MANEAREYMDNTNAGRITVTIADGTAIAQGSVMVWSVAADKTAVKHSRADESYAGIMYESKVADDGVTTATIMCATPGCIAEFIAGGTIRAGDLVKLDSTANRVVTLTSTPDYSATSIENTIGKAIENQTVGTAIKVIIM